MSKKGKVARIVGAAGLALAAAGNLYAQTPRQRENYGNSEIQSITLNTDGHSTDITAVGDGTFGKDYFPHVTLYPNSNISLEVSPRQGRADVDLPYHAREKLRELIRTRRTRTPEERTFKHYLEGLVNRIQENPRDISRLNQALSDMIIDQRDSLYNSQTGYWEIRPGTYMMMVESKDRNGRLIGSVPVFLDIGLEQPRTVARRPERQETQRSPTPAPQSASQTNPRPTNQRPGFEFGPSVSAGRPVNDDRSTNEISAGAFVSGRVAPWLRFGAYGEGHVANNVSTAAETDTTYREAQRIGPNLYKDRTDVATSSTEEKRLAEAGLEFAVRLGNGVEIPIRVGAELDQVTENLDETSAISFSDSAGQQVQDPSVIGNSQSKRYNNVSPSAAIGLRAKLFKGLYLEAMFNWVNSKISNQRNRLRAGLTYRF